MKLAGKVAIVTGAGRGIGRGIARELAKEGARVAVNYATSEQMALELVEEICQSGQEAFAVKADMANAAEVELLVTRVVERYGGVDILVNNAAISLLKPFLECTEEIWDRTVDTNLKGPFFCSLAAAKVMAKRGGGKIINIGSVHGYTTIPGVSFYAASKGGLNMLTKAMALDLAPFKINVNCIAPGTIEVEKYLTEPTYDRERWKNGAPWGRVGFPEDIAKVVVFFASEESDYITGQVLYVDGGITARTGWYGLQLSEATLEQAHSQARIDRPPASPKAVVD